MSAYRTKISIPPFPVSLNHHQQILSFGSCFVENIGNHLKDLKFNIESNPFGILYNPISIANGLHRLLQNEGFTLHDLVGHNGMWHSFAHHGVFSHPQKETALRRIQRQFEAAKKAFSKTNRLILTFGTAHVFEQKSTHNIVANCHKFPNQDFERKCLTVEAITNTYTSLFQQLKAQNPEIQVITTISPVRHIRDGLVENQKSKAILRVALANLCDHFDFVHYFPAYEVLVDDLRDYRFYAADMIHPSPVAVDYVWERFQEAFFDERTKELNKRIEKVRRAMAHRQINEESEEHQDFLRKQLAIILRLKEEYSFIDFEEQEIFFNNKKGEKLT